ncbi:MAG: hypothetical protein ACT4OJ_13040 [Bacteroidota bacterium]
MAKTSKKHLSVTALPALICFTAFAQAKSGVENYNLLSREDKYLWMPIVHYQSAKGVYAEFRYNYEDSKTFSLYGGKTFDIKKGADISLTPMIGFSAGNFKGISLAVNTELDWKNWYVSSQMQYSMSLTATATDFYFCWSEAGYNISPNLFAGFAFQLTRQDGVSDFQPGFLGGVNFGNVSVPVYFFNPFRPGNFIILGLNYEYQLKKREKPAKSMYLATDK